MINYKNSSGFIHIIILIVVILVILALIGFDINSVWLNVFKPIFDFIGNIIGGFILFISSWIVGILR